jgi:cell wall-associated NlpC family hydrolase
MYRPRIICILILIIIGGLMGGCGLRQKYRVDNMPEESKQKTENDRQYSGKDRLNGKTSTAQLIELGRIIQRHLGRPYSGKSDRNEGLDCSEFVQNVFTEYDGTKLPRTVSEQIGQGYSIDRNSLKYGDLVFFRTEGRGASHVGIFIGYKEFIHSSASSGVVISSMNDKYWKKRFAGARRILR